MKSKSSQEGKVTAEVRPRLPLGLQPESLAVDGSPRPTFRFVRPTRRRGLPSVPRRVPSRPLLVLVLRASLDQDDDSPSAIDSSLPRIWAKSVGLGKERQCPPTFWNVPTLAQWRFPSLGVGRWATRLRLG